MSGLDNRPALTYPGDVRETVGQVVGPTLAGELLVVDEVDFDEVAGSSRARFRYAVPADLMRDERAASVVRELRE